MNWAGLLGTRRARVKARLRSTFAALVTLTGIAFLWRVLFARRGVRILAYHSVETPPPNPFAVSVEAFREQIAYIAKQYDVIDFATFLKWQRGEYESRRPKIILTFDDGFANNLKFAVPTLKAFGLSATFFVIASKLDAKDDRFMTTDDVKQILQSDLFRIGSHSFNHRSISHASESEIAEEIIASKAWLESRFDGEIAYFCYPYGTFSDFDARGVALLRKHGYVLACTSVNGVNFKHTDQYRLRRTKVEWNDDAKTFSRLLDGALDGWIFIDYFLRFLQRPRAVQFAPNRLPGSSAKCSVKLWAFSRLSIRSLARKLEL